MIAGCVIDERHLSNGVNLRFQRFAQPLRQIQGVMICWIGLPCSLVKEDGKAAPGRFGSDISRERMTDPVQHDHHSFRIFRNRLSCVPCFSPAPVQYLSLSTGGALPERFC